MDTRVRTDLLPPLLTVCDTWPKDKKLPLSIFFQYYFWKLWSMFISIFFHVCKKGKTEQRQIVYSVDLDTVLFFDLCSLLQSTFLHSIPDPLTAGDTIKGGWARKRLQIVCLKFFKNQKYIKIPFFQLLNQILYFLVENCNFFFAWFQSLLLKTVAPRMYMAGSTGVTQETAPTATWTTHLLSLVPGDLWPWLPRHHAGELHPESPPPSDGGGGGGGHGRGEVHL